MLNPTKARKFYKARFSTLSNQSKDILQSNGDYSVLGSFASSGIQPFDENLRPEHVTNIGRFNFLLLCEIKKWRIDVGKDMLYLSTG